MDHSDLVIIKPKPGLILTPEELEQVGNLLGSAYYNTFTGILGKMDHSHPFIVVAKTQFKEGMTLLGLASFCIE